MSIDGIVEDLQGTIYDHIRTIRDPEKPNNLEELNVVDESLVHVYPFDTSGDKFVANIEYVPTVQHCSLAPLIGTATSSIKLKTFFSFSCLEDYDP